MGAPGSGGGRGERRESLIVVCSDAVPVYLDTGTGTSTVTCTDIDTGTGTSTVTCTGISG